MATLVGGDPNAPFSIATTPRCRREHYSIPWIAPFYPLSLTYSTECEARQHQEPFFESLVWLDLRLNPGLPDHWRTLYSLSQWPIYIFMCNCNQHASNHHHNHHHVTPSARISLTLSRHSSLSSIASGRPPGLHPVSTQSWSPCLCLAMWRGP